MSKIIAQLHWHLLYWYMCGQKTVSTDEQIVRLETLAYRAWGQKDRPRPSR